MQTQQRIEVNFVTLYERELQKMIRGIPFIQRYTLAGKAILGSLDKELRIKIGFVTTGIAGHYDALKIRVINRTEGEVDGQIFKFKEILSNGKNLAIDEDSSGPSWGFNKPLPSDYAKINQCLHNYLSYYAPEQEPQESQEMSGQSM